jgi:hypothetical protein
MESDVCCKWRKRYGSRGYNWEDAILKRQQIMIYRFLNTDNSSTYFGTEGIVNRTGLTNIHLL